MQEKSESHTVHRYDEELHALKTHVMQMGILALSQLRQALEALKEENVALGKKVIEYDNEVNRMEVEADALVFHLLARRCPMASDLRRVVAAAKIINDLERVGDETVKIAHFAVGFALGGGVESHPHPHPGMLREIRVMGQMAVGLLRQALEVYDLADEALARKQECEVREMDGEFHCALRKLLTYVMEDARNISNAIDIVIVLKALERIGDHAQNIVDYVVFQVEGEDVRHAELASEG